MIATVEQMKHRLESTYDVPFSIVREMENGEPCFIITPVDAEEELFSLRVSFSNRIRLSLLYQPHKFSAPFIRSMGKHSEACKSLFCSYAQLLINRNAKINMGINDVAASPVDYSAWPTDWKSFSLRVTKLPISESDDFSYCETAYEWASLVLGMILTLVDIEQVDDTPGYAEGKKTIAQATRYERNPLNRKLCLEYHGTACCVCGMDFGSVYGEIGEGFIHVHHLVPVSTYTKAMIIDPQTDLVPICPNCHVMVHQVDPPLKPDELRKMLKR